ncbi:uncharacterized protein LOC134270648 [Saccostrea cucullata]|uniref:uncharacterized protein LOC134270648 n=1 Tax=Saccostrea cuccullata TaxID=36930 RepID=UPI002ED08677
MGCCYSRHQDEDVPPNIHKRATKHSYKRKAANKQISTDITRESSNPTCYEDNEKVVDLDGLRPRVFYRCLPIGLVVDDPGIFALQHPKSLINSASDPIQFVDVTDRNEEVMPNINIIPNAPPPPVLPL